MYSNGYYKNGGQDVVLWCEKSEKDIISILSSKNEKDTLNYDFFMDDGIYYLKVRGIRRLQDWSCFPGLFKIQFVPGKNGVYIVSRTQTILPNAFEAELYEFFIKKAGCIPKKKVGF